MTIRPQEGSGPSRPRVAVVMATYNGERYLREQLDSILAQTYPNLEIVVADDRSSDGSVAVLQEYAKRCRLAVRVNPANVGAAKNFETALGMAHAPYFAFADQDDVWMPDKIESLMTEMAAAERERGADRPILVFSDMVVTDAALAPISPSFFTHIKRPATGTALNRLLLDNVIAGCSMLVNRALVERALPVPPAAYMHDYWLALVASAFGAIRLVPRPLVLYRQHGHNTLGAEKSPPLALKMLAKLRARQWDTPAYRRGLSSRYLQAAAFLERFESDLSPSQRAAVHALARFPASGFWKRRYMLLRHGLLRSRFADAIEMLVRA